MPASVPGGNLYGTVEDFDAYLQGTPPGDNVEVKTMLLASASRFIDRKCGQWFYNDGSSTKYFDGEGGYEFTSEWPFFSLTALKMAYFENQPLANWLTATGDGIAPPSNFWLTPRNPRPAGSSLNLSALEPYWGIDLATIPSSGTAYLPAFIPGKKTVAVTASWGWPAVPDMIKNLSLKLAVRAWQSRQAGWSLQRGSPDLGYVDCSKHFDQEDNYLLLRSGLLNRSF